MSKSEIEKKLEKIGNAIWDLDMKDHWSRDDYERYDQLVRSELELKKLLKAAS